MIQAELMKIENDGSKSNLINTWYNKGWIKKPLKDYWSIEVYATDNEGLCWGRYNPQILPGGTKINFDYIMEATDKNKEYLLREIEKRAFKGGKK